MGDLEQPFRRRQADRQRVIDQTAAVTPSVGEIFIKGAGQALHHVDFAVLYTEKPLLVGYGFDMAEGQVLDPTNFPVLSIGVFRYSYNEPQPSIRHYKGADVIIVATGHDGMLMNIHYRFEGIALAAGPGIRPL